MTKYLQEHLDNISEEWLIEFRLHSFSRYAATKGYEIGISGLGEFVVRGPDKEYWSYSEAGSAIDKYSELLTNLT